MKKWILILIGAVGLSATSELSAQNLDRAIQLVEEASEETEDVAWITCPRASARRFRMATYKLETALIEVRSVRRESREKEAAINAISLTIRKINDRTLSNREKKEIQDDCSDVAIDNMEVMIRRGDDNSGGFSDENLSDVMDLLDDAEDCTYAGDYAGADRFLAQAQEIMENYRNERDLRGVLRTIQDMRNFVCSSRYSHNQKTRYISDEASRLKRRIRRSRAYERENRGGGWRWNRQNDFNAELVAG